jgi:hypothetical protein
MELTRIEQKNLKSIYKYPMGILKLYRLYNEKFNGITRVKIEEWLKNHRPPKQLSENQKKVLERLYYEEHNYLGIQKLYTLAKNIIPITRIKVKEWIQQQKAYQLHKPINFKVRNTKSFKSLSSSTLAIDLIDMTNREINNYKYILTCIDIFSKYTYLFPITQKKPENIEKALAEILKDYPFKVIITDNGTEFQIKKLGGVVKIIKTQTYNPTNNAIVERQNRNVRDLLRRYFESDNTNWVKILPKFAKNINNTYHRTIKDTPYNVFKNYNEEQLEELRERLKKSFEKNKLLVKEKIYKVNDNVRIINRLKQKTKDKHLPNWSTDTYIIYKVIPANENVLTRYKLINTRTGEIEKGTFNGSQLQVIKGILNSPPKKTKQENFRNKEIRELERIKAPENEKRVRKNL